MYAFPYLSRIIGAEMFARLVAMMPPPLDASPEARRDRDIVAMATLKQMGPLRSSEEASLAITIVAADAHAHDALRGAAENAGNLTVVMQCRAQANAMMRTRHKAAAELEALMRSRIAAERLMEQTEPEMEARTNLLPPAAEPEAAEPLPVVRAEPAVVVAKPAPKLDAGRQAAKPVVSRRRADDRNRGVDTNVTGVIVSEEWAEPAMIASRGRSAAIRQAA